MKKAILATLFTAAFAANSQAAELKVKINSFESGSPIPDKYAHCIAKGTDKSAEGENISPTISWDKAPEGAKSFALIVVDRDVPTNFDDANQEGKIIAESAPRQNFYHWILLNIPVNITSIPEGAGKDKAYGDQIVNDFFKFSGLKKTDQNMKKFLGYDGPCPPWNDERIHNYHFKVYALKEVFNLGDDYAGNYAGDDIVHKIAPYIISEGEVIGTYTLNPTLRPITPKVEVTKPAETKPAAKK